MARDANPGKEVMNLAEKKTNKDWYPYKELGGYFKLIDGDLYGCPMNVDGSREDNPYEVDWYEAWDNDVKPEDIILELESKP
jgi:hypothetical protein